MAKNEHPQPVTEQQFKQAVDIATNPLHTRHASKMTGLHSFAPGAIIGAVVGAIFGGKDGRLKGAAIGAAATSVIAYAVGRVVGIVRGHKEQKQATELVQNVVSEYQAAAPMVPAAQQQNVGYDAPQTLMGEAPRAGEWAASTRPQGPRSMRDTAMAATGQSNAGPAH